MSYKYAVPVEERCGISGNDVIILMGCERFTIGREGEDKGGTMASQDGHVKRA